MPSKYAPKDTERFWQYVDKDSSLTFYNGTRCWEWTGGHGKAGYGLIKIEQKKHYAHRISYILAFGDPSPEKPSVLHHCDNRSCVRPEHLFSGTHKDNMEDMVRKGRQAILRGEEHGSCKLTDEQVSEIRRRYAWYGKGGETSTELAKVFGVSSVQIHKIVTRKSRA